MVEESYWCVSMILLGCLVTDNLSTCPGGARKIRIRFGNVMTIVVD